MAIGNIFNIPVKQAINVSLQGKSIMVVGKSKAGKSTLCSQAPRGIWLMTENGGEALTGFTPVPIASWSDFKNAVTQLCSKTGRENFDTVVIDTYTNLILLLDKFVGQKFTTEKATVDFGSDAEYGKGTKAMRNELGVQLQRLANQGYLILNVVHAEDKTDFATGKDYIGTSLSNSLYGLAEKFVDQIIYLNREAPHRTTGAIEHRIYFNTKGGFGGAGGRFTADVDSVPCNFKELEAVLLRAMEAAASDQGAETVASQTPSVVIDNDEDRFDFAGMVAEFKAITDQMVKADPDNNPLIIKNIVETELGVGKKVATLAASQAELLANILHNLKNVNEKGEDE